MRKRWTFSAAAVLAVAAASTAFATIPSADGVIHGCFKQFAGTLRLVQAGEACAAKERPIAWNAQGPKGDTGPAGPAGPQGPAGPTGPAADFGTGAGLEKLELHAPPPIGDQTLLQLEQGYRLPQGCAEGSVPRKTAGVSWTCGSGSGGGSAAANHAYHASGMSDLDGADAVVASVTVPAGSYVVTGKASLYNADEDEQDANCKLSTGDITHVILPGQDTSIETVEVRQAIPVQGVATLDAETTIRLTCATFDGHAFNGALTALRVGGIN
jgi:hypothetical protein